MVASSSLSSAAYIGLSCQVYLSLTLNLCYMAYRIFIHSLAGQFSCARFMLAIWSWTRELTL